MRVEVGIWLFGTWRLGQVCHTARGAGNCPPNKTTRNSYILARGRRSVILIAAELSRISKRRFVTHNPIPAK